MSDGETADTEVNSHLPPDDGGSVEHPGVSTSPGVEEEKELEATGGRDSIHSDHSHTSHESIENVQQEIQPTQRSKSRTSSVRSRPQSIVPRNKRRGLLGKLALLPEVDRPYDYKRSTKWLITLIIALAAAAGPMGSSIFLPALPELSKDLHVTPTIANLSVALYMLSMAIFPLWWSSFSETLGRRTIYLVSFALFAMWNIVSAESTSIGMLIVMRLLGGGASASVQAVGAGTIADIWEPYERGRAMGIFYLGPLLGPLLAPIIGGALSEAWGWRATQWFQVIYGGILLLILTFCLPETLARREPVPVQQPIDEKDGRAVALTCTSTRQSMHIKTKNAAKIFKRCIIDPLSVLAYLRFPAVFITVYLASITFGCLFVLNISIQKTFSESPYDFKVIIVGLLYIPNSLGYLFASVFGGKWTDVIMHREARKVGRYDEHGKLIVRPEDRLRENAWLAAIIYPGALIWYGWSADKGVIWIVPMIANFFFGIGSMIIFGCVTTMLTEFMPRRSSSGVAVNNFIRNIFSCVGGIVAQPLINAIGNGWLFTALGIICWISAFSVIWAMKRFGPQWRIKMDKALNK